MVNRIFCCASLLFVSFIAASAQTPKGVTLPPRHNTPQEVLLMFSGDTADERLLLTLNNNRGAPLTTGVTIYTVDGTPTVLPSIDMVPGDSKIVELSAVLQNAGLGHQELGWLKLDYNGMVAEMGAQLTLYPVAGGSGVDSPRALTIDYKSAERATAFWIPEHGHAHLSLTNASAESIFVKLKCSSLYEEFVIPAKMTKVKKIELSALDPSLADGDVPLGCDIVSDGAVSALRPVGTVLAPGYSAPIRFYDPKTATFSSLTAVGLSTSATTHVTVQNLTDLPVDYLPILRQTTLTNPYLQSLSPRVIPPHGTQELDIAELTSAFQSKGLQRATLTLKSSAPLNAFIGSVTQVSTADGLVEDIPLKTSNPAQFARGSYPLRWDGDYTNMVFVTNTADKVLTIGGEITAGDVDYVLKREPISPGATKVYDVDKLRVDRTPDVNGKLLPLDAKYGKIHWIEVGRGSNAGLMGRTSLSSLSNNRLSSFSCSSSCDGGYMAYPYFNPSIFQNLTAGALTYSNISSWVVEVNGGGGGYLYPGPIDPWYGVNVYTTPNGIVDYSEWSDGTGIDISADGVGTTSVAYLFHQDILSGGNNGDTTCQDNYTDSYGEGSASAVPEVSLYGPRQVALENNPGDAHGNNAIKLSATGSPSGGTYAWSVSNSNIALPTPLPNTATITITAAAVGPSTVSVTYTVDGQDSSPKSLDILVVQPSSVTISADTSTQPTYPCVVNQISYAGPERHVLYAIDALQNGILLPTSAAVSISEQFVPISSSGPSCGSTPVPTQNLGVTGAFNDNFYYCSSACLPVVNNAPQGSCTLALNHIWTANGFTIFNHTLTYTCTNISPQ